MVRLRLSFAERPLSLTLVSTRGSHAGQAFWSGPEWEQCQKDVAVVVAGMSVEPEGWRPGWLRRLVVRLQNCLLTQVLLQHREPRAPLTAAPPPRALPSPRPFPQAWALLLPRAQPPPPVLRQLPQAQAPAQALPRRPLFPLVAAADGQADNTGPGPGSAGVQGEVDNKGSAPGSSPRQAQAHLRSWPPL